MPHLQVHVDEETRLRLAAQAKRLGRTVESIVREAVDNELARASRKRSAPSRARSAP